MISKKFYWISGLIILATVIVYYPCLDNEFMYELDDSFYITNNPVVTDFALSKADELLTSFYVGNYHPLTMLTFVLEYQLFGNNPFWYHLTNVLLHLINTALVFYLSFLLFKQNLLFSGIVALLFALHPMHVESVAWISERKDVLYSMFFLGGLISYLRYIRSEKACLLILSLVLFICSLLSKPMAVTFPLVVILMDFYLGKKATLKTAFEKAPFLALSVVFGIISLSSQQGGNTYHDLQAQFSVADRFFLVCYGICSYLAKLIAPFNLSAYHFYPEKTGDLLPWVCYASPALLLLPVFGIYRAKNYKKILVFGSLFFLFTIAPVLQVYPVGMAITAERYTYIPYLGLFMILAKFFTDLRNNEIKFIDSLKPYLSYLAYGWLVVMTLITWKRIEVWQDGNTLFSDVIKKYPSHFYGYYSRGMGYFRVGNYQEALEDLNKSIQINPNYAQAYGNRASIWWAFKNSAKASADLDRAIALKPDYETAYSNRGLLKDESGDYAGAIKDYDRTILIKPDFYQAYLNRGIAYGKMGQYESAIRDFSIAIDLKDDYFDAYVNRAMAYDGVGNYKDAADDFSKAMQLKPNDANIYVNRGLVRQKLNDMRGACADWTAAARMGDQNTRQLQAQYCK